MEVRGHDPAAMDAAMDVDTWWGGQSIDPAVLSGVPEAVAGPAGHDRGGQDLPAAVADTGAPGAGAGERAEVFTYQQSARLCEAFTRHDYRPGTRIYVFTPTTALWVGVDPHDRYTIVYHSPQVPMTHPAPEPGRGLDRQDVVAVLHTVGVPIAEIHQLVLHAPHTPGPYLSGPYLSGPDLSGPVVAYTGEPLIVPLARLLLIEYSELATELATHRDRYIGLISDDFLYAAHTLEHTHQHRSPDTPDPHTPDPDP